MGASKRQAPEVSGQSVEEVVAGLRARGYREGAPNEATGEIDRSVCANTPCPRCGGTVGYRPFHKRKSSASSYVALGVCSCGFWADF